MMLVLFFSVIGNMILLGNNIDMSHQLENLPQCTPITYDGMTLFDDQGRIVSGCTNFKLDSTFQDKEPREQLPTRITR